MIDWYENREKLEPGQVFLDCEGCRVRLVGRTAGDGTKWDIEHWSGYANQWLDEGGTIEPGDLQALIPA